MALRTDDRQFIIYDPNVVSSTFDALQGPALYMFGVWLQRKAAAAPSSISDNLGIVGSTLVNIGETRQRINAGLSKTDVPDELAHAQRMWDVVSRWLQDPSSVPHDEVASILDEFAGAMAYLNERTFETGTHHPRWNARLVSGQPCPTCGR